VKWHNPEGAEADHTSAQQTESVEVQAMARFSPTPQFDETAAPWLFLWIVPVFVATVLAFGVCSQRHRTAETGLGMPDVPGLFNVPGDLATGR
jgi:hypothetical protein